jgi:hypothetical protein
VSLLRFMGKRIEYASFVLKHGPWSDHMLTAYPLFFDVEDIDP